MASNYDRIMASRQRWREQANLTEQDYENFRQIYLSQQDPEQLKQNVEEARQGIVSASDLQRNTRNRISDRGRANMKLNTAVAALQNYQRLGGSVEGVDDKYWQELEQQYTAGLEQMQRDLELKQYGRMGRGGAQYRQKQQLQEQQYQKGQSAAQWSAQAGQAKDELEMVEKWQEMVRNLPQNADYTQQARNKQWMDQAAAEAGIASYTDQADLSAQLAAKADQLRAKTNWNERNASRDAQMSRTAMAMAYNIDHPEQSLDESYYAKQLEDAQEKFRSGAYNPENTMNLYRASDNYANARYERIRQETLDQIAADAAQQASYQEARDARQALRTLDYLENYIQSELSQVGALSRDSVNQIRLVAEQNGVFLPQSDDALQTYVTAARQRYQQVQESSLQALTAAGYDEDALTQYMDRELDARQMEQFREDTRQSAQEHPVATSAASTATNLVSGIGWISSIPQAAKNAWAGLTGNYDAYTPINTDTNWYRAGQYTKEVREEVAKNIESESGTFLYETGMSMLDNLVQMAVGAVLFSGAGSVAGAIEAASPVTLGTMGMSAATNEMIRLTDEGVASNQAMLLATTAGALEIVTEKIGLDNLVNNIGRAEAAGLMRTLLRQAAAEGGEEALAEVGNMAADCLVRMSDSEIMQAIEQGQQYGMTQSEAVWSVVRQKLQQTGMAALGGALSGAVFGAGGFAVSSAANSNLMVGRQIKKSGNLEQLQQQAERYGVDVSGMPEQAGAWQTGKLAKQVAQAAQQEEDQVLQIAAGKQYDKEGQNALLYAWNQYRDTGDTTLGPGEFAIAFDTAYQSGKQDAEFGTEGAYLERAATDALVQGLTPGAVKYAYTAGLESVKTESGTQAAEQTPEQNLKEGKLQVAFLGENDAQLVLADGTRKNLSELETKATAAEIVVQAMEDGYGARTVNQMLGSYDGTMAPEVYYEAYRAAMTAGMEGETLTQARKAAQGLPEQIVREARDRGRLLKKGNDVAERIGAAGRQVLEDYGYDAPVVYEKFYRAGLEGKNFQQAQQDIETVSEELKQEMQAAVNAGLRDRQGGFTYEAGRQSGNAGQERQDGMGTGEPDGQVGTVAENDSGAAAGEVRSDAPAAQAENSGGQSQKVSARELGIPNGTEEKITRVISERQQTKAQRKLVAEYRERGIDLVLVEGGIQIEKTDGTTKMARGMCLRSEGKIFVQVDDAGATEKQIAIHEAKHLEYYHNPELLEQEWEQFAQNLKQEDIDQWLAGYADRYGFLEGYEDEMALIEEAMCDYYAQMEEPAATEEGYTRIREIRENKKSAREGGKYAIKEEFGKRYVQADRKVLQGNDPKEWGMQVERYINEKIRQGEDVLLPTEDGDMLLLTERSAYKLRDRNESRIDKAKRKPLGDRELGVKLRAAAHIDELVQVGIFDGYQEDHDHKHNNDIGEDGFQYYTVYFRDFGGEYYRMTITAAQNGDESTVYSIGNIRKRKPVTGRGSSSGLRAGGAQGAQGARNRLSGEIIAKAEGDVKAKTEMELAFEQAEKKKKEQGRAAIAEADTKAKLDTAEKRIKALEKINKSLREQMRLTPEGKADPVTLRRAARHLMQEYGGSWSQKEMEAKLQEIYQVRKEQGAQAAREKTQRLASELVRNYLDKDNPDAETIREIKQKVRATRVYLTPDLRADLDQAGGYEYIRKHNMGRIRLANSGIGVDQLYQELSEQYPGYFPEEIWNPADQLLQILDVINDGTQILQRSPLDGMPDAISYMTTKIQWELRDIKPAPQTRTDKLLEAAAKVSNREQILEAAGAHEQEQMDQLEAYYQKKLQQVKADREDRIQKVKDRYKQKAQAERDWKKEQALKQRLLWHGNKLKRMSRTATPQQQEEILKIFGDINTVCLQMTGYTVIRDNIQGMSTEEIRPDGFRDRRDPRRTMSPEEAMLFPETAGDKVVYADDLKKWYEEQMKTNPDFLPDKRVEEILKNWEAKQIGAMTAQEAQALLDVALNIENEIRTQKKLIDAQDKREIYQQVQQIIDDVKSCRGKGGRVKQMADQATLYKGLTPVRMMHRITGYHDSDPLYQSVLALQDGEVRMLDYQRRAYEMFEPFTRDKQFMQYLAGQGKNAKPITLEGMDSYGNPIKLEITPDMRVALALHSKNYQNLRHIQRGGIKVPEYRAYVKGNFQEAYDNGTEIRMEPSQVRAIAAQMTEREKAYARAVEKYYNTMSKAEVNEVSVKLKGYEVAKVNNYYPIETNKDYVTSEYVSIKFDGSLEGFGFLRERIESGNPILLGGASNTLAKSVRQHSMYVGLAIPMRNFNKLRGVNIMKSDPEKKTTYTSDSIESVIRGKWGTPAIKYMEKLAADLSGVKTGDTDSIWMKLRSNYAGAVLTMNPSTAMKQFIAYPSAGSVLGFDALANGLKVWQRVDINVVKKYTPLLWHRMQGYIDADLGDYAARNKKLPKWANWNQGTDIAVVKRLWAASQWKVAKQNRSLVNDMEAWNRATAELFNQVMLEAQANYAITGRGQMLRSDNFFDRTFSMFKTEPFQQFNVLYDAAQNLRAKKQQLLAAQEAYDADQNEQTKAELQELEQSYRQAKIRIRQAVPAALLSQTMEASIVFVWALIRGKTRDWEDEEGNITPGSFAVGYLTSLVRGFSSIVPYVGQIAELITSKATGGVYYGLDAPEFSMIDDTLADAEALRKTIWSIFTDPELEEGEEATPELWRDKLIAILDATAGLSRLVGLPGENVLKSLKAVVRSVLIATMGQTEGLYWYNQIAEQTTKTGHAGDAYDTLYALVKSGNKDAYEKIYDDVMKYKDTDDVYNAINRRAKDDYENGAITDSELREIMTTYGGKLDEDVDSYFRDWIKELFNDGQITDQTAWSMLTRMTGMEDEDELYWTTRGWAYTYETGEEFSRFDELFDAVYDGEADLTEVKQELLEHGYTDEEIENKIQTQIGEWYRQTSSDDMTITREAALQMLLQYADKTDIMAEKLVTEWTCYLDNGITYSDRNKAFREGVIDKKTLEEWNMEYGGMSQEVASETADAWATLLKLGEHYIDDDSWDTNAVVNYAKSYNEYGDGINFDVWVEYKYFAGRVKADPDPNRPGETIPGSAKKKVVAYIADIPGLTAEQRNNMLISKYPTANLNDLPW